jgi:hypothetical protein
MWHLFGVIFAFGRGDIRWLLRSCMYDKLFFFQIGRLMFFLNIFSGSFRRNFFPFYFPRLYPRIPFYKIIPLSFTSYAKRIRHNAFHRQIIILAFFCCWKHTSYYIQPNYQLNTDFALKGVNFRLTLKQNRRLTPPTPPNSPDTGPWSYGTEPSRASKSPSLKPSSLPPWNKAVRAPPVRGTRLPICIISTRPTSLF